MTARPAVQPFALDPELKRKLLFTGLAVLVVDTRVSHALVDGGYASRRTDCETACRELGVPSLREATLDRVESLADSRIRRRARHVVTEIGQFRPSMTPCRWPSWS